jgi:hypothetical protein
MIPTDAQLAEFKRLYKEAKEVALNHDEFLKLVFNAATDAACDCQAPVVKSGAAGVSEDCPIHAPKTVTVSTVF